MKERTEQQFLEIVGRTPGMDDMERWNCPQAGRFGHSQCGHCEEHNKPRFICGCFNAPAPTKDEREDG